MLARFACAALLLGLPGAASGQEAPMRLRLADWVGQQVEVPGQRAIEIWQHLMGHVPGKQAEYFDPADGGNQLVAHVSGGLPEGHPVVLWGTVLEVRGPSKRPRPPGPGGEPRETKVDDTYVEYALDVDRVVLVPAAAELPGLLERLADPGLAREARRDLEERLVAAGLAVVPLLLARPVDARCQHLLDRIVRPRNHRAPDRQAAEPRPAGSDVRMFRAKDWKRFFEARQGQSLAEIREGLKPAVDRWWRTRGEEQVIE
jgi:hypothetical protein